MDSLLQTILQTPASIADDDAMRRRVISLIRDMGIPAQTDPYGNIYATKGDGQYVPCFVAHLDTVHTQPKSITVRKFSGQLRAYTRDGQRIGIGGDDKCGIYACLRLLRELPTCKVVFFRHEESGGGGSARAEMTFFDNCAFVAQIDRAGNSDVIPEIWGIDLATPELCAAIRPINEQYGRSSTVGMFTDVEILMDNGLPCSALNMSAGYYLPHTRLEYIVLADLLTTVAYCRALAERLQGVHWPAPIQDTYSVYGVRWGNWSDTLDDDTPKGQVWIDRCDYCDGQFDAELLDYQYAPDGWPICQACRDEQELAARPA